LAFAGALGYADITLLAPSAFSLRQILCTNYVDELSISFNASTSKCTVFRHVGDNIDDNRYNQQVSVLFSGTWATILMITVIIFTFVVNTEIIKQWSHLGNITNNSQQNNDCILFRLID